MKNCLITFRSVTPAQRAERLLRGRGFDCTLRRTPRWMEEQGCGYSVQLPTVNVEDCIRLLRSQQIPFRKVYLQRENGAAEELTV